MAAPRLPLPAPAGRAREATWACVLALLTGGCNEIPAEALGSGESSSSSGGSTSTSSTSADGTSTGSDTSAGSTTLGPGSDSTTAVSSTGTDDGSSSGDETGMPMPACGDGLVAMGELCHELGPPIMLDPSPNRIASGDLDQDGAVDLLLSNSTTPEIWVLYGVGNGDFVAPQLLLTAGASVQDLAVDDLTGDGWPDLVITDGPGQRVVSYANDGAGSLFFAGLYPTSVSPQRLVVGDVNGDGTPDLVAAGSGNAALLLGNGLGGFLPLQDLGMPSGPHRLGLVDLDADGMLDLVTVNFGGGNTTAFLGDGVGLGEGTNHDTAASPESLALGDIDETGPPDMLVVHASGDDVGVLLGDGAGGFGSEDVRMVDDDPRSVALADLDSDGHLDLLVAHTTPGWLALHQGVGDGTFVAGPMLEVGAAGELLVTEVNGDGVPDVVVLRTNEGAVQVLRSAP